MIPLLVDLETEWRGGQNQFLLLLKGLYERGHAAELLAVRGSALAARAHAAGICVHLASRRASRFGTVQKIHKLLAAGRIDLVHVNESHALTAAWLARAHRRVPLIVSRRVGYPLSKSWLAQRRFHAAAAIIANSRWVAEQAIASGAPKDKLKVVYEGVQIPELPTSEMRREARERWGVSSEQPLLGCVGVLSPDKGHEFVIRALAQLRDEFPGVRLLLAGDGPRRAGLEELARTLGVFDSVIFAGFVKDIEAVYAALDIFVLPSLFEGLNNSLMAAMAFAVPSVAFSYGAPAEIIVPGVSGLLVPPKDSENLTTTIRSLFYDAVFAKKIALAGRVRIERVFSADQMVDNTLGVYRETLDG
jgi:glycosyltransferase involved in cell wall biosynthesis